MNIINAILHQIETDMSNGELAVHPRDQILPESEDLYFLLERLNQIYNDKPDKLFSQFQQDKESYPMQEWLAEYLKTPGEDNFVTFSNQALDLLKLQMAQANLTGSHYVLFIHYKVGMTQFLMVLMLHNTDGFSVDETLNISDVKHLDISKMSIACRINVSEWQNSSNPIKYISFIKVRGKSKTAEYFKQFIGCTQSVSSADETKSLLGAVDAYCQDMDDEVAMATQQKVNDYCKTKAAEDVPFTVQELTGEIFNDDPDSFLGFASQQQMEVAQPIYADKKSLSSFNRISGKDREISISFSTHALKSRIQVDLDGDKLVIQGIPETLKQALLSKLSNK